MNILFINHHHLNTNSGIHIFNLANHLSRLGMDCTVCVPEQKETVSALGKPAFETLNFSDLLDGKLKDRKRFDLIHAWTPREIVRKAAVELRKIHSCPLVLHLEDNEDYLIEALIRLPVSVLRRFPHFLLNGITPDFMSHPLRYPELLRAADGGTVIMDGLREFFPADTPVGLIWAGYQEDMNWSLPKDMELRHQLKIADQEFVVVYTGNVHRGNYGEVSDLYAAITDLRRRGVRVRLVRTGNDHLRFPTARWLAMKKDSIELGRLPRSRMPSILSIADALVQPGEAGPFNSYRFPSKLPEYLASGRPVVLPNANIGKYLVNNEECLLLEKGDAQDIAQKIERLILNEVLRKKIGAGGRLFAEKNLKWGKIAEKLHSFYQSF